MQVIDVRFVADGGIPRGRGVRERGCSDPPNKNLDLFAQHVPLRHCLSTIYAVAHRFLEMLQSRFSGHVRLKVPSFTFLLARWY